MDTVKGQLLGYGQSSDIQEQIRFDDGTMGQCCLVALRVWGKDLIYKDYTSSGTTDLFVFFKHKDYSQL